MVRIAGIGGGTGLPMLLRGLRQLSESRNDTFFHISAIVCVSDNGGSSGHLRQSFRIPALGDLRNCLVALSRGDCLLSDLFQYRFSHGNGLEGHSLGNLVITALSQMAGNFGRALDLAKVVLCSEGCVLPATDTEVTLCAELESGNRIRGEWQITAAKGRIKRVWLDPSDPPAYPGVLETISSADAIILGPGSLYTSIIPNLLVNGVADAIQKSNALKIHVCNLATQPGETGGFAAEDHLRILDAYLGCGAVDICVINSQPIHQISRETYLESGSEQVAWSEEKIRRMGILPVVADLLSDNEVTVRHDPLKLARLIKSLAQTERYASDAREDQEYLSVGSGIPDMELRLQKSCTRIRITELQGV